MIFVSFSGGLDSTTVMAHFLSGGSAVQPVFFHYGSKHNPFEYRAARTICAHYALPLETVDLTGTGVFRPEASALMAGNAADIPALDYRDEGALDATVVPGRNLVMIAMLASLAEAEALKTGQPAAVALAAHGGDHALYPDCRPPFLRAVETTLCEGTEGRVAFLAPFADMTKIEILQRALDLAVPVHLTRSCYQARETACGVCGTCRERGRAFAALGLSDPAGS